MKLQFRHVMMVGFLTMALIGSISAQKINFEPGDTINWDSVMVRSKVLNRLLFIYAYSDSSPICKLMEKKSLNDMALTEHLNVAFVNLRLNMDSASSLKLASKFKINCVPSYIFVDRDGNTVIQKGSGFYTGKDLLALSNSVADPHKNTFFSYESEFNTPHPSATITLKYLKALSDACMPTNDLAVKFLTSKKDTDNLLPEHWEILRKYVTDIESVPFKYLVSRRTSFIAKYSRDEVDTKIFDTYLSRGLDLIFKEKADKTKYTAFKTAVVGVVFDRNKELGQTLDWYYADATGNWKDFYNISKDMVKKYKRDDAVFLNDASARLLDYKKNSKMLSDMLQWSKKSTELKPGWQNQDTYAKILFKTGDKQKALENINKAIQIATTAEVDTIPLVKTRDLFNQPGK